MENWLDTWGERPEHKVRPFWSPPSLLLRQMGSALYIGALARWKRLPRWVANYGFKCIPGAAGSWGMGCIGFPAHPVWEMTAGCNLHCIHCHASGGKPAHDELSTAEAKRLIDQLAEGGRLVIPVGTYHQDLKLIRKVDGKTTTQNVIPVRFVPMTGEAEK